MRFSFLLYVTSRISPDVIETELDRYLFPLACAYAIDQLLDDDFLPD